MSLKRNFARTLDAYVESYSLLLGGEVKEFQVIVVRIEQDESYYETPDFHRIFERMQSKEAIDIFNIDLLCTLYVEKDNNIARISYEFYDIKREEFLASTVLEEYVGLAEDTASIECAEAFAEVKLKLVETKENWRKRYLKDIDELLKRVYEKYCKLPTKPVIKYGIVTLVWNTPKDTKKEIEERTEKHATFLKSKGALVEIDGKIVLEYWVSKECMVLAYHNE